MRQTLRDYLDLYAYINHKDDIMAMLQDYILDSRLSREQLNRMIVLNLGERSPYFTHTELIKANIENWFATHEWNIRKLCDTLDLEYNPLYDKDWYEDKLRDLDGTNTGTEKNDTDSTDTINETIKKVTDRDEKDTTDRDEKDVRDRDVTNAVISDETVERTDKVEQDQETKVSAYNEASYQPQQRVDTDTIDEEITDDHLERKEQEMEDITDTIAEDITKDIAEDITEDTTRKLADVLDEDKLMTRNLANTEDELINIHHYGKENDMTYAEMIEKERRQAQFNIYEWIIEHLGDEILLGVYF